MKEKKDLKLNKAGKKEMRKKGDDFSTKLAEGKTALEIVLKCDSVGSEEAVLTSLAARQDSHMNLGVIHSGVGAISKSDMLMALTGSRLVVGFNVDVLPKVEEFSREQGIEVRLYNVIYTLTHDLHELAESLAQNEEEEEKVIGTAKVIALFKSTRKGIILGCEVVKGILALGKRFRITTAMGPIYTGKIESLHIENDAVSVARKGQQVGLKISDFKKGKMGDLVECLETSQKWTKTWQPRAGVFDLSS